MMPMNQVRKHSDPLVASAINWPSSEAHHPHKAHESFTAYQSTSGSTSAANHSHNSHAYENAEPQATPSPTFPSESVVTSEPTSISETLETKSEQPLPLRSVVITSEPTSSEILSTNSEQALPSKSATSEPTFPSQSIADYRHKRKESRSKSPEKRHPKAAVKWHKIRHLWLDSD